MPFDSISVFIWSLALLYEYLLYSKATPIADT